MAPPTPTQEQGTRPSSSKPTPGRRDPERRRQQNLRAQKKHREKVKARLAELEARHGHALPGPGGATGTTNLDAGLHQSAAAGLAPVGDDPDASASVGPPARAGVDAREDDKVPARDAWDPTVHFDPFLVHRLRRRRHDDDTAVAAVAAVAPFRTTTTPLACNCRHAHATLVQTHDGAPALHLGRAVPAAAAADPYANHLRVEALCTIAALQAAGAPLGVAPERMCARDGAASPFARPGADAGALRRAARLFASLPRDLRPGAAQLARPHPPVVDALPFPTLRRNLVRAGWGPALEAFFFDLLVGLVCWARDGDGADAPRPWEARAWEARPWFLRKYWALLGGEAGELVRQSAWWRSARGEFAGLVGA